MPKESAGILLYRKRLFRLEVLLVHPGGPFWARKDIGSWSVPKGEYPADEEPRLAAVREFREETGYTPSGKFIQLASIRQKGHKTVHCWAVEGNFEPDELVSNTFEMEWPPRSGKRKEFPEVDKAAWFSIPEAKKKINERQVSFLEELEQVVR